MKKLIFILFLICSTYSYAANLQPSDTQLIKAAGVPLFSTAMFVFGSKDLGFRFVTSTPPDDVRRWYRRQLPKWSLLDNFGSWILYNGNPGLGMGAVMSKNQINVQNNNKLPGWYALDKNMTTEIVIMIVK
ncbi:hypothetical protein BMS3Abin07_02069 [bacterium BMS3Abin07]|nr:hypothetical protein BMS3Abin07_02069 [bacterium BMS3Abin07]GBE32590.1 hypothetical protein BMS3Bbin05_01506 [bacterium BMS3Bbin05]HDO21787.1 hypothetical protein [Nitrospirota bacterium]HDZ87253.1 hypothetical protein [Nitrospirota bacterium]